MLGLTAARLYQSRLARPLRPALRHLKRSSFGTRIAASIWFPPNWLNTLRICRTLAADYAHLRSAATGRPIDADGRPIPWYTYPAIEFLRQLDFSQASVFEYGSGNSTLFWSSVAHDVVSVEDDESWYTEMARVVPANCRLLCQPDLDRFVSTIDHFDTFDVVIVDGPARGRTRLKCATAAVRHLRSGGMIIVDNADWLPQSTAFLRDSGLLQIDMTGFSPINSFTGTTSFFFDRSWQLAPKGDRRPLPGVGARVCDWEPCRGPAGNCLQCGGDILGGVSFEQPLQFELDGEPRHFRIVSHELTGGAAIAILDDDQERVLLSHHRVEGGSRPHTEDAVDREARRISGMSADEFRDFINSHPSRRYKL
jgi:hypothetical protein